MISWNSFPGKSCRRVSAAKSPKWIRRKVAGSNLPSTCYKDSRKKRSRNSQSYTLFNFHNEIKYLKGGDKFKSNFSLHLGSLWIWNFIKMENIFLKENKEKTGKLTKKALPLFWLREFLWPLTILQHFGGHLVGDPMSEPEPSWPPGKNNSIQFSFISIVTHFKL
jgi:hypothetical protein